MNEVVSTLARADRVWLASLFQSKEETRYYLNGVHIVSEGEGVNIVSTDGQVFAAFHCTRGHTMAPCIVPLPADAKAAIKRAKNREYIWFGIIGEHRGTGRQVARVLDTGEGGLDAEASIEERLLDEKDAGIIWSGCVDLIDGTFPDYRRIVPARRALRAESAHINGKFFDLFRQVSGDKDRKSCAPVRLFSAGDGEPILVECGRPDFIGVVMPMRSEILGAKVAGDFVVPPAWCAPPAIEAGSAVKSA